MKNKLLVHCFQKRKRHKLLAYKNEHRNKKKTLWKPFANHMINEILYLVNKNNISHHIYVSGCAAHHPVKNWVIHINIQCLYLGINALSFKYFNMEIWKWHGFLNANRKFIKFVIYYWTFFLRLLYVYADKKWFCVRNNVEGKRDIIWYKTYYELLMAIVPPIRYPNL